MIVLMIFFIILDNQDDQVNQNKDDIDSPPDFMFTLFIQQNAEIKSSSSPRSPRRPSLAIIMQQNEVRKLHTVYFS